MKKGDIVKIYEDPHFCNNLEGEAKLLKNLNMKGLHQEYWEVRFLADGFICDRWINNG